MAEISKRKFEFSAVHHMLGLELQERSDSHAVITMEPKPEFLQEEGVVQGGILTALADAAAVYVTLPDLPVDRTMTSIEFKLNFLRPALLEGGTLTARSKLIKGGRTIALVKSTLTQGDREIATGLFTYMLMDR